MLLLVGFLAWHDVDPTGRPFDPSIAAAIAERHVLAAVGGDRTRNAPVGRYKRAAVGEAIDRDLVAAYGPWAAGWNWAASEPGDGGPVRAWCCADDSILRQGDRGAQATIDRVVAAVTELRAFVADLAGRFAELAAATASLPVERRIEHAAAQLLPLVIERTAAEDAWYATFARVLGWYVESIGLGADGAAHDVIAATVRGHFESWCAPSDEAAAAACAALGADVARAARDDTVHDALPAWRKIRADAFASPPAPGPRPRLTGDAHRAYIDEVDGARDPERASRMAAALALCRASAARGEPLTFERLAAWQGVVLGREHVGFRTEPAYAREGRVYYELGDRTRRDFEAALAEADGPPATATVRAARVYLDLCFFHPFVDGNARAARLALDHTLARAGLGLQAVAPVFVVARAADDRRGAWCLIYVLELLLGTT